MSATPALSRRRLRGFLTLTLALLIFAPQAAAQWVQFADETSSRLVAAPGLGVSDPDEKDYAWGDVDMDGDIDLVCVRKEPFTSPGKRPAVLFMNQNGVLTDRTADFASDADVAGDLGFLTPTNNRDVVLADVDMDGWLDIITAVTISDGDPKHIGHPRIYHNKGNDGGGNWLGFRFENSRIPFLVSNTGASGFNPRFCTVVAGDVTGDGYPELWFGDYDSSGAGGNSEPPNADFDDRLLFNRGAGAFAGAYKDESAARFSGVIQIPGQASQSFLVSAFGAAGAIADMNGDGLQDIVKQTSLNQPLYVGIAYNEASPQGVFDTYEVINQQSPYFVTVGDLNNDNKKDIVITDDGADRYLLNQGNGVDGLANFLSLGFSFDAASDDGFGSDSVIADLNMDGWNDVLITDVDVDISGCNRRMHIYRNLGGQPGGNVTLQEQTSGTNCQTSAGNPATCLVASIPSNKLEGVHDVAVFDVNGDGWLDLVVGRCTGTEVYVNQPPVGLAFSYPQGLPFFVPPGETFDFQVQVTGFGGATHVPGSGRMFASVAGGPFNEISMSPLGGGLYQATLPAAPDCTDAIHFYFTAGATGGGTFLDPPGAPADTFTATAAAGTTVSFQDGFEGSVAGWTIVNDPSLTAGQWQQAIPVGTITGGGQQAAPSEDGEGAQDAVRAFVTQNGAVGGAANASDVDGGPTDLISPVIDLAGTDANITYSRWFFSDGTDTLTVWVSNNGTTWTLVETVAGLNNSWQVASFRVGDFVPPTSTVRVRFRTSDSPNNSVTEAAIDLFRVEKFVCNQCVVPADCDDAVFCNGAEACQNGSCLPGSFPCPGQQCDEATDTCVQCVTDAHCDDGLFCNGAETCAGNVCIAGGNPCPGQLCNEGNDTCVDCLGNRDCDDGLFCNGAETCNSGSCFVPAEACPGQLCDENNNLCIGTVSLQPRMGQPLLALTGQELDRFQQGKTAFDRTFSELDGLGPIFNQDSCASCHNTRTGGSGSILVTRFGHNDDKGGGFDPLVNLGGSLLQSQALQPQCTEQVPPEANVVAQRLTNSTLGFGLVEAVPDAAIQANANNPPPLVSGRVHMVPVLETPPLVRVGRFGWKSQVATVLSFSGDAALNEMGITNRLVPQENAPNGDQALLALCDHNADPEDQPDPEGFEFIDRVTDFQRFLAAPPQTPRSGMHGETVFNNIGCASCHVGTFATPNNPALEDAIRSKTLHPYSDFLLHDMGQTADFIVQGGAQASELRTAPLWGFRVRDPQWHDGRVAGGTFASRVLQVIDLHDALNSEAQAAANAFKVTLSQADKDAVIAFLDSLGRAEFDHDGDNDVDGADYQSFLACFTGPGNFYTADAPCAISDVDQDGDVDSDDFDLFVAAAAGDAGEVSSTLMVGKQPNGDVTLSWGASCLGSDLDYEIYQGTLVDFSSRAPVQCGTGGATSATFAAADAAYFLVVPSNGFREGSYGSNSSGAPRLPAAGACLPQSVGTCQ